MHADHDYELRRGWGHSPARAGVVVAERAGAKKLALFHHSPDATDDDDRRGRRAHRRAHRGAGVRRRRRELPRRVSDRCPTSPTSVSLGASHASEVWAGATDPIVARPRRVDPARRFGDDRDARRARRLVAACKLVVGDYAAAERAAAPRSYVDAMIDAIERWLAEPTQRASAKRRCSVARRRRARSTRGRSTDDAAAFWILEAVDHAGLAVWVGERAVDLHPAGRRRDDARRARDRVRVPRDALAGSARPRRAADAVIDVGRRA